MSIQPMTCQRVGVLKAYLATVEHNLESKPNGQNKYTFPDGLVLNVYDTTGRVVFQGEVGKSEFAKQIVAMINQMNIPVLQQ